MAKLSGFKRVIKEEFKEEYQELIDKLGYSVNSFAEEVINAFNGNINEDNILDKSKTITTTLDSSGIPTQDLSFKSGLVGKTKGIIVVKAENLTNPNTYPTGAPFCTFSENNGIVSVSHITGLPASQKYRLTLKIIG